jgi:hypothetical protein
MKASWLESWPPRARWGKLILNAYLIEKYFYMGHQVSDVAHHGMGLSVFFLLVF